MVAKVIYERELAQLSGRILSVQLPPRALYTTLRYLRITRDSVDVGVLVAVDVNSRCARAIRQHLRVR